MDKNYILHLLRVAKLTKSVCKIYFHNESIANTGFFAGLTHDVGKLMIDDKILNKAGKLTTEEFEIIKKHTNYTYELLKEVGLNDYAYIGLHHHEQYNGKGYPKSLKGKDIPLLSRIVAICDVFDAMTNKRIYRKNVFSLDATLEYIRVNTGEYFDPELARFFMDNIETILLDNELEECLELQFATN